MCLLRQEKSAQFIPFQLDIWAPLMSDKAPRSHLHQNLPYSLISTWLAGYQVAICVILVSERQSVGDGYAVLSFHLLGEAGETSFLSSSSSFSSLRKNKMEGSLEERKTLGISLSIFRSRVGLCLFHFFISFSQAELFPSPIFSFIILSVLTLS